MKVEYLPFTIGRVRTPEELAQCTRLRKDRYGRHLPQFALKLAFPEPEDSRNCSFIFLATSKADGSPVATSRLQTNIQAPLPLEQAILLPEYLRASRVAEATRFVVSGRAQARTVRNAVLKQLYLACVSLQVDWIVIGARPPLEKLYLGLMFQDIFPGASLVPLPYADNIPHRILALRIPELERRWRMANHPLYDFFFHTFHPDLEQFEIPGCNARRQIMQG